MSEEKRAGKKNIFKKIGDYIKHRRANVLTAALVALTAGLIIVPPLIRCAQNNSEMNCRTHIYDMNLMLKTKLIEEAETGGNHIRLMAEASGGRQLIKYLSEITPSSGKFDESDYYFVRSGDSLELRCVKHDQITGIKTVLPPLDGAGIDYGMPPGGNVTMLTVSGQNKYKAKDLSVSSDSAKTVFYGDEIDGLINGLTVTAHRAGGTSEILDRADYTVTCEKIDIKTPGIYTLTVHTKSGSVWSSIAYASFEIEILTENSGTR